MRWHWGWVNKAAANHTSNLQQKNLKTDFPEHLVSWIKTTNKNMNLSWVSCECSIFFSGLYGRADYTSQIWHGDLCFVPKWFFPCSKGVLFQDPCYWHSIYIYIIYICSYVYVCIQVLNVWLTCLHLGSLADKPKFNIAYIYFLYIVCTLGPQNHEKWRFYTPNYGLVITPKNEGCGFPWYCTLFGGM